MRNSFVLLVAIIFLVFSILYNLNIERFFNQTSLNDNELDYIKQYVDESCCNKKSSDDVDLYIPYLVSKIKSYRTVENFEAATPAPMSDDILKSVRIMLKPALDNREKITETALIRYFDSNIEIRQEDIKNTIEMTQEDLKTFEKKLDTYMSIKDLSPNSILFNDSATALIKSKNTLDLHSDNINFVSSNGVTFQNTKGPGSIKLSNDDIHSRLCIDDACMYREDLENMKLGNKQTNVHASQINQLSNRMSELGQFTSSVKGSNIDWNGNISSKSLCLENICLDTRELQKLKNLIR